MQINKYKIVDKKTSVNYTNSFPDSYYNKNKTLNWIKSNIKLAYEYFWGFLQCLIHFCEKELLMVSLIFWTNVLGYELWKYFLADDISQRNKYKGPRAKQLVIKFSKVVKHNSQLYFLWRRNFDFPPIITMPRTISRFLNTLLQPLQRINHQQTSKMIDDNCFLTAGYFM